MDNNISAIKVVIGIPTFKRPQGLRRLLDSLAKTQAPFTPHILVADNEGSEGAGIKLVSEIIKSGTYPFPLHVIAVPERGISQARNGILTQGFEVMQADYLAMVDDDETVEPDWIAELVKMQQQTGADVVSGIAKPIFEINLPSWAIGQKIYMQGKRHQTGIVEIASGSGHTLYTHHIYKNSAGNINLFDYRFSLSGGEDTEYFERLRKQGVTFAYTSKAISYEHFPASRVTKKWAIQRTSRMGASHIRIYKLHGASLKTWVMEIIKIPAGIIQGIVMGVIYVFNPAKRMKAFLLIIRQIGKIKGFFGRYGEEYKVTHGK